MTKVTCLKLTSPNSYGDGHTFVKEIQERQKIKNIVCTYIETPRFTESMTWCIPYEIFNHTVGLLLGLNGLLISIPRSCLEIYMTTFFNEEMVNIYYTIPK